jgi:CRP/FNR family transcriptional regulator, cyclic AMP receptor protein
VTSQAGTTDEATPAAAPPARVALLRVDARLRAAVPAAELAVAQRVVVAPCLEIGPGAWTADGFGAGRDAVGALLVRGVLTRETTIAGRRSADLLVPGDVLHPWRSSETAVPGARVRWASGSAALVAVLDDRFLAAARRWPGLLGVVHERLAEQLDRATVRAAIMALPRVEQRVLGLFWQIAERFGRVRPEGVVIELVLTHELIGQLIGAQRPTVSLALQALAGEGLLERTARGAWLLAHDARSALPDVAPIGPVQIAAVDAAGGAGHDAGGADVASIAGGRGGAPA